ncbi:MAG: hypothetical protein H0W72_12480, partial [Planctomycetes bacterium]|nr:hypothetical protein [Planctomycetota bacterium]
MAVFRRAGTGNLLIEFTLNGERVRESAHTTDRKMAKAIEARLRQEVLGRQRLGKVEAMTLAQAMARYERTVMEPKGNPGAAKRDRWCHAMIAADLGADTQLEALTARRIAAWRDRMIAEDKAPASVNK